MASTDQIYWAYNTFLERNPESQNVVEELRSVKFEDLCVAVARSSEFVARNLPPFPPETLAMVQISDDYGYREMWVDLGDQFVSWSCIKGGYEPIETAFIINYMRQHPGGFVDGGANIGWHSLNVARVPHCIVYSFEPRTFPFRCLARTAEVNRLGDRANIFNFGLADIPSKCQIFWAKSGVNPGGASIDKAADTPAHHQETIELKQLDSLCLSDIKLIKLDIEGAEYLALKGATETIARCSPAIVLEVLKNQIERVSGVTPEELVCYLRTLGYQSIAEISADGSLRTITNNDPFHDCAKIAINLACFRSSAFQCTT